IINNAKRLFVVGTTSLRAIESSFEDKVIACKKSTKLFIYPGYKFNNKIHAMITNFHLPKSSLLLLVSAYIGKETILKIYEEAKKNNYRFYSFGDAMLLIP
ncbi:S-adenosylmethionine:tRNA ribosyltransferase-isomerase, partial [Candidatus Woesearchaeota archaeon]|nr:S-adenosylmethionine:tRNA ribosyltransferase-isomerase [Candidatus Woesearchaeota archaeon]